MSPKTPKQAPKRSHKATKTAAKSPVHIPQPHGGALLSGGVPGNRGGGRPPDMLGQKLREIGMVHAAPLLEDVMQGKIRLVWVGTCPKCKHVGELPEGDDLDALKDTIRTTVDQQLKASDQTLRYAQKDQKDIDYQEAARQYHQCVTDSLNAHVSPQVAETILGDIRVRLFGSGV